MKLQKNRKSSDHVHNTVYSLIKLWKAIKDHISVTKGSITSKNFKVLLANLTQVTKLATGKFEVCSWRKRSLFNKKLTICKYRFARSRERPIHDFTASTALVENIDGAITVKFEM